MLPINLSNHIPSKNRVRVSSFVSSWANFSPVSLKAEGWWDASDTTTITQSSNAVSQWNDKSGWNRHFTQATLAARPTTNTETQNGLNVLRFDGSNDGMTASAGNNGKEYVSMLVVMKMRLEQSCNVFSTGRDGTFGGARLLYTGENMAMVHDRWGGPAVVHSSWDPGGPFHVFGFIVNAIGGYPSSVTLIRDRTRSDGNPGFLVAMTSDNVDIGYFSTPSPAGWAPISVAEIVLFHRTLETRELNILLDYFSNKWGLGF